MNLIEHPEKFKTGVRVLLLRGRPKDGLPTNCSILRVTNNVEQFDRRLAELSAMSKPGERIYGSAGARDMKAAVRLFKERQLAADYDGDPLAFYRSIESRWASCVQAVNAQLDRLWLFDCDTGEDRELVEQQIRDCYPIINRDPYWYATKSGHHCVVQPFDKSKLNDAARAMIHDNAIILWGW